MFVCNAPLETPTGRFLGVVGVQRLLREAPSKPVGRCLDEDWEPIDADASEREVAERIAAYDVVAIPVTDGAGRLVGAVTVDDVLDRVLPADWRVTHAGRQMARPDKLGAPRGTPGGPSVDPDAFGRMAERMARFLGTGRYLVFQTLLVIVWIILNLAAVGLRWDPYPFILLNLAFSTQAAYAAPLILLAQNRQADRDREEVERDRDMNSRSLADTEFLAREMAAIRIALEQKTDREDLSDAVTRLVEAVERSSSGDAGSIAEPPDPA